MMPYNKEKLFRSQMMTPPAGCGRFLKALIYFIGKLSHRSTIISASASISDNNIGFASSKISRFVLKKTAFS